MYSEDYVSLVKRINELKDILRSKPTEHFNYHKAVKKKQEALKELLSIIAGCKAILEDDGRRILH